MATITSKGATLTYGNDGLVADNPKDVLKILKEKGVAVFRGVLNEDACRAMNDECGTRQNTWPRGWRNRSRGTTRRPTNRSSLWCRNTADSFRSSVGACLVCPMCAEQKVGAVYRNSMGKKRPCSRVSMGSTSRSVLWCPRKKAGDVSGTQVAAHWPTPEWQFASLRPVLGHGKQDWGWWRDAQVLRGQSRPPRENGVASGHSQKGPQLGLVQVQQEHLDWFLKNGAQDLCVACEAGDQVFWDSRLVHSGTEFVNDEDCPARDDVRTHRNVVYVCMHPREEKRWWNVPGLIPMTTGVSELPPRPNKMKLFGKYPNLRMPAAAGCKQTDPTNHWSFVPKMPMPQLTPYGVEIALGRVPKTLLPYLPNKYGTPRTPYINKKFPLRGHPVPHT